jgi:hypothetical protein
MALGGWDKEMPRKDKGRGKEEYSRMELSLHHLPGFGPFHLDFEREVLYRDGKEVKLRPIAFAVLRCLYEHRNEGVLHKELEEYAWGPKTLVADKNRTQTVKEVKDALKEYGTLIKTRHKRGYVLRVEEPPPFKRAPQRLPDTLRQRIGKLSLRSDIERAVRRVLTADNYPTMMTLAAEVVVNPIWRLIPAATRAALATAYSPFGDVPPRIMHLDIFLLRANDKMGRPRLLNYFSGKPITGWQSFMLLFRHRRPGENESMRQRENAKDIAEFLGLSVNAVHAAKLGNQFAVSVKPDPGYSELVTYVFEFCSVQFKVAPGWMRSIDCTLTLDTSTRRFR